MQNNTLPKTLQLSQYEAQEAAWPKQGRTLLAQYDDNRVVVYQAYSLAIADFAVKNGYFGGGGFSLTRMSWIKPGFLWMMFRSGWAAKPNQERVLAISIQRTAFDEILSKAVEAKFVPEDYESEQAWKDAIAASNVRLQWDPDHSPSGEPLARRAIQLGLRADVLANFAKDWIVSIEDITPFVHEQASNALSGNRAALITPLETPYPTGNKHRPNSPEP